MGQAFGGPALLLLLLTMVGGGQAISHQLSAAPPRWGRVTTGLTLDHPNHRPLSIRINAWFKNSPWPGSKTGTLN